MAEPAIQPTPSRLTSLDGLRGVAAVIVMVYHYTQRYRERFDADWHPLFSYDGQFGVLLFFMISGYVITLTTRRVQRPADFLFFRFSRLYPTFWVCMIVTSLLMWTAHAPKPLPTPLSFLVNLTMLTKTIRRLPHTPNDIPYIDGAYWSLEIELFFYGVIFLLLLARQTHRVVGVAIALTLIGAIDHWMLMTGHAVVPSPVRWILFFEYWPYFGIGIALFAMRNQQRYLWPAVLLVLAFARASERGVGELLKMTDPDRMATDMTTPTNAWVELLKVIVCAALFAAAVFDRLPPLRWRAVVAVGAVSYPLYLLHQNIGYIVIGTFHNLFHVPPNLSIGIAIVVAMILAGAVSFGVERPTMHLLRRLYLRWANHRAPASLVSGLAPAVPVTPADQHPR